jgi:mono/diheme cytochrome c family protein
MHFFKSSLIFGGTGILIIAGTIYFGLINPGADEPHSPIVYSLIQTARDRAIAVRAADVVVPALNDPALIKQGAGNYAAMCTGCHLAPGVESTEMSKILYPAPPNLSKLGAPDPARAFWVIKHGIKASGMAAWGKSMEDQYIWNLVAFVKQLPSMSPEQYHEMVEASGGHSHGGGEGMHHDHEEMEGMMHNDGGDMDGDHEADHHHEESSMHRHSDGSMHEHGATPEKPATGTTKADSETKPQQHENH